VNEVTKKEMALVLAKAAAFDARTIGDADVEAWHECVGDLDYDVALERVTEHFRHSRDRLMPADLLAQDEAEGLAPWERDPGWYSRREGPVL
jgi:hypothetical protein